ncbi:MAG: hypothetical protein SF187_14010 [Deltaproteobacteria bacterium]|nr:hypothetical protein [Deltaproteobacteria bacterium]
MFDATATSWLLRLGFLSLGLALAVFWLVVPPGGKPRLFRGVVVAGWLGAALALSRLEGLRDFSGFPPPLLRVLLVMLLCLVALAFSPWGRRLARALPLWLLVGFQSFRVVVELLLHSAYSHGLIGAQMTYLGRNLDIVSGISALAMAVVLYKRALPKAWLWAWNFVGLALLVNILVVAALSMPTPARVFMQGPPNVFVAYWPFILLPTAMVASAWFGHMLLTSRLLQRDSG